MTDQLVLIELDDDTAPVWQLDDATREVGRRGVARARAALMAASQQGRDSTVSDSNLPAAA